MPLVIICVCAFLSAFVLLALSGLFSANRNKPRKKGRPSQAAPVFFAE